MERLSLCLTLLVNIALTPTSVAPAAQQWGALATVASRDGTRIVYWTAGTGPALILVHGGSSDHTRFAPVLEALSKRFTVYAMDRRGRGNSGDSSDYSLQSEYEDILAVIEVAKDPIFLLGHSFGGICALEAAVRSKRIRRLVLYEPPVAAPPNDNIPAYEALLAEGQPEAMLLRFLRENARLPESEIEMLRKLPTWSTRVSAAYTIPRELRVVQGYKLDTQALANLGASTLLLLGEDSPQFQRIGTEELDRAIPDSRIAVPPGQQHSAMMTAPSTFAREVQAFLEQ